VPPQSEERAAASGSLSRRRALEVGAALLAGAALASTPPVADADVAEPIEHDAALEAALPGLSNWGRWGIDDQLGTLNFITPAIRAAAAGLIRSGRVVAIGREFDVDTPELRNFSYEVRSYLDPLPEESGSLDVVGLTCHGFAVTHVDALCHIFTPEGRHGMYNGYSTDNVRPTGSLKLGIEHVGAQGIVGRGVLLDVAGVRGGPLPLGTPFTPDDLEAAERQHGVLVGEGDIVFVRNGAGPANTYRHGTGLHASCLRWLKERRVAVIGNDSDGDVHPPLAGFQAWTEPLHMVGMPYLGLTLLDQAELDDLAATCAQEARWAFFVTAAPWRLRGATGSVVNPLAIF
jgi:kynurenine formamidase